MKPPPPSPLPDLGAHSDDLGFSVNPDYLPRSIESTFPGHLIVIEGPDGSGRTTQLSLLSEWLEWQGFAVKTIGIKRSQLLSKDLDELTRSNEMHLMTQVLLYATDLYDQIEHRAVPALRAGFVVLADRYTLSLQCRASLRSVATDYLDNLYAYAPTPDLCLRLEVTPETAFQRLFARKSALNHWEFGGDLNLSGNVYDSFLQYQGNMQKTLAEMGKKTGYRAIDGDPAVSQVNHALREALGRYLGVEKMDYSPSDRLRNLWELR